MEHVSLQEPLTAHTTSQVLAPETPEALIHATIGADPRSGRARCDGMQGKVLVLARIVLG